MRLPNLKNKGVSGFTLVEMAIVLVIIGIILAGVMKGRDIVRGAQVKQFSQQFAQKWGTMASTYYDKTGQFLADGQANGGNNAQDPDGIMDCGIYTNNAISQRVHDRLEAVGINTCTLVKSKLTVNTDNGAGYLYAGVCGGTGNAGTMDRLNPFQTTIDGEFAALALVSVDLCGFDLDIGGQPYRRNVVVLYNVPVDVANGLDTAIDGVANGQLGSCIGLEAEYDQDGETLYPVMPNGTDPVDITATAWGAALSGTTPQCQTVGIVLDY